MLVDGTLPQTLTLKHINQVFRGREKLHSFEPYTLLTIPTLPADLLKWKSH